MRKSRFEVEAIPGAQDEFLSLNGVPHSSFQTEFDLFTRMDEGDFAARPATFDMEQSHF